VAVNQFVEIFFELFDGWLGVYHFGGAAVAEELKERAVQRLGAGDS